MAHVQMGVVYKPFSTTVYKGSGTARAPALFLRVTNDLKFGGSGEMSSLFYMYAGEYLNTGARFVTRM
jgi:hypothetical protein